MDKRLCKHGHDLDLVGRDAGGHCLICARATKRAWYGRNREAVCERVRSYYQNDDPAFQAHVKERKQAWYQRNKDRIAAKRRAKKGA